ncbi:alpha/beta fold hydrolase [Variovorax sp. YR266]|uniref:alpha/beta fold hydrolase n=1 Tax=Variovorax sp. YR266 TaxID=1884386 RepID=UPI0015A29B32|nr:alpha/beta hydrolase [Variovorax sp. YR266]
MIEAQLPPLKQATLGNSGDVVAYRESRDRGDQTVIFLHGIGGNSSSSRAQFAGLQPCVRAIAWDAPGYGGSTCLPPAAPSVSDYSARLLQFIETLALGKVHLAATSWGTLIGADFAGRYPEHVHSLCLSGATAGTAPISAEEIERLVTTRLARDHEGLMGRPARTLVADDAPAIVIETLAAQRGRLNEEGFSRATRMLLSTHGLTLARTIKRPTLFLAGEVDRVCPPDMHAAKLHREVEDSVFESFAQCGHILELEAPMRLNASLQRFMAQHSSP